MLKVISTDKAPAAIGPYSQAMVFGNLMISSGQIPIDPATGEIAGTTIEEQAEQVMKNIEAVLEEAGAKFTDVMKTTCFLADMGDFAAFNEIYGKILHRQTGSLLCCCKNTSKECSLRSRSYCGFSIALF